MADRIAYINHDIDDSIRAGILTEDDIPLEIRRVLGFSKSSRINTLVRSAIKNSGDDILLDDEVNSAFDELHAFMFDRVYTNPVCKGEEGKAMLMLKYLYDYLVRNPDKLPEEVASIRVKQGVERAACDYIAGMTDRYAVRVFNELFVPFSWSVDGV